LGEASIRHLLTVEDIEGLLMAGTPADIARDTKRYENAAHHCFRPTFPLRRLVPTDRFVGPRSSAGGKSVNAVQIVQTFKSFKMF